MTYLPNKSKNIRWGIIGCGDVTEVKSGPAYQKTEGFKLIAVMRRNPEKVREYAKRHQIDRYYENASQLINDKEVDAVYIATPPDSHMHYALMVAEAGKICCIEKPMAPSYIECKTIYEAFKEKEIPLFVAYYRRSLPRFLKVQEWIKEKAIGEIRHISWQLHQPPKAKDLTSEYNWRTDPKVAPGGYFDDLASHGLDLFTFLLGGIKSIHGISLNQQQLYGAKDAFTASWLHEGNITGAGSWNFGTYQSLDKVEIFGSHGKIEFSVFDDEPVVLQSKEKEEQLFIEHPEHVQMHHVENMKKHLFEENYLHPSTGLTALHTSWVMDKILGEV